MSDPTESSPDPCPDPRRDPEPSETTQRLLAEMVQRLDDLAARLERLEQAADSASKPIEESPAGAESGSALDGPAASGSGPEQPTADKRSALERLAASHTEIRDDQTGASPAPQAEAASAETLSLASNTTAGDATTDDSTAPQVETQAGTPSPVPPGSPPAKPIAPSSQSATHAPLRKPAKPPINFEWLLGARGLALVGVIVVVFGVGAFLKMAYDEGWITKIAPVWRCVGSGLFGVVLLGVGEFFRRRISPLASSGVSAAGLAIIYSSILAAAKLYELLNTPTTFALLAVVTIVGVLLGALERRVMLSLLSLAGAFLTPLLLATGEPSYYAMALYLLALLVLGLALSAWRGGAFAHVRRLAWWGVGLLGTLWLLGVHDDSPASSLGFIGLAWALTITELILSARFFSTLRDRTDWSPGARVGFLRDDDGEIRFELHSLLQPEARWVNAAFGVTAWSVASAAITLRAINPELDVLAPIVLGLLSGAAALFTLRLRGVRFRDLATTVSSPHSALAAALVCNAALLGVAAIATGLGGWVQVVAWAGVGVAAIETARRIRFRMVGLFGSVLILVSLARLIVLDSFEYARAEPGINQLGLALTAWSWQVMLVAAAWVVAAWRIGRQPERSIAALLALAALLLAPLHEQSLGTSLGPLYAGLGLLAVWITVWLPAALRLHALRVGGFVVAGFAVLLVLGAQSSLRDTGDGSFVINPWAMGLLSAAWIGLAAVPGLRHQSRTASAAVVVICAAIAIGRVQTEFTLDRMLLVQAIFLGVVVAAGVRLSRWSVHEIALVALALLAFGWGLHELSQGNDAITGTPFAHPGFPPALLMVLSLLGVGFWLPRTPVPSDASRSTRETRASMANIAFGIAWTVLLASSSIESIRMARALFADESARGAVLSIWWSLYAVGSVVLGFRVGAPLRWAGLGLLGLVAAKVMIYDTVTLNPPSRVLAAITVGLIIIGASVLYAWLVKKAEAGLATPESDDANTDASVPDPDPESAES